MNEEDRSVANLGFVGLGLMGGRIVKRLLDAREKGLVCGSSNPVGGCTSVTELFNGDSPDPKPVESSNVFRVRARARVFDVERSVEAVIDRSKPSAPLRLKANA